MAFQARETGADGVDQQPFRRQYRLFHAAFTQFCYTGAQVGIASFFINYASAKRPATDASLAAKLFAGAQAAFAVGRFAGVGLMRVVRPRRILLTFLSCAVVFLGPAVTQRGDVGAAMLTLVLFFESICFPTIVALGMRGLGRHTKRGSGYIVGGVVGGACVLPLTGLVGDRHGDGAAMAVPLVFLAAWSYALCVNLVPAYCRVLDSCADADVGLRPRPVDDLEAPPSSASSTEKVARADASPR